jgi:hypothetical protein
MKIKVPAELNEIEVRLDSHLKEFTTFKEQFLDELEYILFHYHIENHMEADTLFADMRAQLKELKEIIIHRWRAQHISLIRELDGSKTCNINKQWK